MTDESWTAAKPVDCGSLLPLCGGRSLLRAARSNFARPFAPRRGQQAALLHGGSRLPQSTALIARSLPAG